jgi:hypothetical protein
MRSKYVEERYGRYFVFGTHSDMSVDVTSERGGIDVKVSPEHAEQLIADRTKVIDFLCALADAFDKAAPEAFKKFWYEEDH